MVATPEQVAALDAALAAAGNYRVTGAYFGDVRGTPFGMIEISFMLRGERRQSWDFNLDGTPVPKRAQRLVVAAVQAALLEIT